MTPVITPNADEGIRGGIVAADAHGLAGISYRQLDHWARQGWVTPSVDAGEGRSGRRRYSADDVVRLDLLRHLAVSQVNPAVAGPLVGACEVPAGDVRIVWGPVGAKDPDQVGLRVVPGRRGTGRGRDLRRLGGLQPDAAARPPGGGPHGDDCRRAGGTAVGMSPRCEGVAPVPWRRRRLRGGTQQQRSERVRET